MDSHVCLQVSIFREALFTDITLERFLARVRPEVDVEPALASVSLAAMLALVWLLACMNEHMSLQVAFCHKTSAAPFICAVESP